MVPTSRIFFFTVIILKNNFLPIFRKDGIVEMDWYRLHRAFKRALMSLLAYNGVRGQILWPRVQLFNCKVKHHCLHLYTDLDVCEVCEVAGPPVKSYMWKHFGFHVLRNKRRKKVKDRQTKMYTHHRCCAGLSAPNVKKHPSTIRADNIWKAFQPLMGCKCQTA